ncbi:MAG: LysR family transcriptional regulator [Eubacteriales bacterium]|nr:LysR family transcriptional regulator [Eubacteriales bacterium]
MRLRYLQEFVVLVDSGSFTAAAKKMNMTQTAITRHLQKLEAEMQTELLKRSTRKLELTSEGRIFYEYARRSSQVLEQMDQILERQKAEKSKKYYLRVASMRNYSAYRIGDLCMEFARRFPNVVFNIMEQESDALLQSLSSQECDIGFDIELENMQDAEYFRELVMPEQMAVLVPKDFRFADREYVSLKQLAHEKFIMMPVNSSAYKYGMAMCRGEGLDPDIVFSGLRTNEYIEMVRRGVGVALVTRFPVMEFLASNNITDVIMIPIRPQMGLALNMICRVGEVSPVVRRFAAFVREYRER